MRIAHYLHIDKRLKSFRMAADMSQKEMAAKLELSVPTYSNYENGYSEPPMEAIQIFCSIIGIKEELFFGYTIKPSKELSINTYSNILKVIMELIRAGIPVECSTSGNTATRRLVASISLESPQVASLVSRWNEWNKELETEKIDSDEYNIWIDSLMNSFNIPVENY